MVKRLVSKLPQMFVYLFFFFVPLQTVYLIMSPMIGKPQGIWQYGVIGLYGTDILVAALVACFVITQLYKRRFVVSESSAGYSRVPLTLLTVGWAIMLSWSLVALVWAPEQWVSVYGIARMFEIGLSVWLLRKLSWSWVGASVAYVSMATLQGVLSWQQFLNQQIDENKWLGLAYHSSQNLGDSVVESVLRRFLRAYGTFAHPNMLGIYMAVALVLCVALLWYVRRKWQGYLLLTAWISILTGLILIFSRAAWIAGFVGILCFVVIMFFLKKHIRVAHDHHPGFGVLMLAISIIVVGAMAYGLWEPVSTRLGVGGLKRLEVRSLQERGASINEGIAVSKTALPYGLGLGQYTYSLYLKDKKENHEKPSYYYQPAHAVPLLVASELGVAGMSGVLLLVIGCIWLVFLKLRNIVSTFDATHASLSLSLLLILVIAMLSDHFLWTTHAGSVMVATILAIILVVQPRETITYSLPSPQDTPHQMHS